MNASEQATNSSVTNPLEIIPVFCLSPNLQRQRLRTITESVPRAVATGSQSTQQSACDDYYPVATARGTDLITRLQPFRTSAKPRSLFMNQLKHCHQHRSI